MSRAEDRIPQVTVLIMVGMLLVPAVEEVRAERQQQAALIAAAQNVAISSSHDTPIQGLNYI